jgi:hypothetical protein
MITPVGAPEFVSLFVQQSVGGAGQASGKRLVETFF